jgi:predicted nucleic acid-binding protein
VRIIVDANVVFSAILNTNSRIADLLLNSEEAFKFLAPDYLRTELRKYHNKISMISKMTLNEIEVIDKKVTKPITFISEILIPEDKWLFAENLAKDIDDKDIPYVAFSLFYNCDI